MTWAEMEFSNLDLGDERINKRAVKLLDTFAKVGLRLKPLTGFMPMKVLRGTSYYSLILKKFSSELLLVKNPLFYAYKTRLN